jgi:hypothetical protein
MAGSIPMTTTTFIRGLPIITAPNPKPMNSNQPTFSRIDEDNIDIWLRTTELNLTLAHIPVNEWVLTAITYIRGSAAIYANRFDLSRINNWKSFCDVMSVRYKPQNKQEESIQKLRNLKQTGSITNYIDKFLLLAQQVIQDVGQYMITDLFKMDLLMLLKKKLNTMVFMILMKQ